MQFSAPSIYFAAFALCAVPLIIYLIFRRRRKDIPWGAVYILRKLIENKSRTSAWKQYFIIALRTLALAALAFVFLRPHLPWEKPADGESPAAPPGTHRMVLLDVSQSMDATHQSGACIDSALSLCRKLLQSSSFPGSVEILPLDASDTFFSFDSPPVRLHEIETFIGELERGPEPVDFEAGLERAVQAFRSSPHQRKELFILSNFTTAAFGTPERLGGLFRALHRMKVRVLSLSYENPDANNFALHEMSPYMDTLVAGQPTIFYVTLGYYGSAASAETWLHVSDAGGNTLYEDTIAMAPGVRELQIPLSLPAGEHVLTASLRPDDYTADNMLARSFHVVENLRAVVIQDINLNTGFENPREWIRLALDDAGGAAPIREIPEDAQPHAQSAGSRERAGYWSVDYVNTIQTGPGVFAECDAAIFLDVYTMPPEGVEAARLFAMRGGTLFLAPGPAADPGKFNTTFAEVLPARLGPLKRDDIDPDLYDSALIDKAQDAVLRELESPEHGNLGNARFYNNYILEHGSMTADAETLFTLSDGSPLCVYRPVGRGGVLLWTAGLGMDWHSMVVHPAYPVLFSRLFNVAAARRRFTLNLTPGQPLISEVYGAQPMLVKPNGEQVQLGATEIDGRRMVRWDDTHLPGVYKLLPEPDDSDGALHYTVWEDRRQSDYRPVAGNDRVALERMMESSLLSTEGQLFDAMGGEYPGRSLGVYAAVLVLCVLLMEAGLARRWFT